MPPFTNILVKFINNNVYPSVMPRDNTKTRRIILMLLHEKDLSKYRIAKETESNISWVIELLRKLEKLKLVKGTEVKDYDKLIDYYLSLEKRQKHFDFHIKNPLAYLKKSKKEYLVTTYTAENLVSHHLFPFRTDVYVKEEDLEEWKNELFKKGLIGKGNLRLIVAKDNFIFRFAQRIKGQNVVSTSLLMIDLKREGGVCMQAYEYLLENVQGQ